MNYQRSLKLLLLALALASIGYVFVEDQWARRTVDTAGDTFPPSTRLVVYYFDQGKDCATCEQIPAYTEGVLNAHFAQELQNGSVVWRSVDTDLPRNEHYLSEYQIYTKSVVLATRANGQQLRWKNLDQVWDLIYDRTAYETYLKNEITAALAAATP